MDKIKNKNSLTKSKVATLIFCSLFLWIGSSANASVAEKRYETLEDRKKNYELQILYKQKQGTTLGNQLKMMDLQIDSFKNDLEITKEKIAKNEKELGLLDQEVDIYQKGLDERRKELAAMLRFFYQAEKNITMSFLAQDSDVSAVLNQSQYIDQASGKIDEIIIDTQKSKESLETKKGEVEKKNEELKEHQETFEERVEYLEGEEQSKKVLLQKTQGQEAQYKKLLTRVEQQMQELIGDLDELSAEVRSDLEKIKKSASKPTSGTASKKWYYAQNDSKWGNKRIGLSNTLMKDYGCAVTAVSMVMTYHKEKITPGSLSGKQIFARDLIVWPASWGDVELDSTTWHGNIDWKEINKSIDKDRPVIVFIRSRTGAGHYVVVHGRDKKGKFVVHDPLFGANIYLDTSRKLVGRIYNSSTTIDQMIIYK